MQKRNKNKAKYFVVFIIAFVAIIFLSGLALAQNKPSIKKGEILDITNVGEYISPIFDTDFKFNVFGLKLSDGNSNLNIRYFDQKGWSDWFEPEVLKSKDGQNFTEPVLADKGKMIQYKIICQKVKEVKIIYLSTYQNSIFPWNIFNFLVSKISAQSSLEIISRADWEADEDWRFNSDKEEIWPAEYSWPEKFVIHHTAGSDGGENPDSTLQGIYYWHGVVLGWGDIGYNYLIDQNGNIYEGRYGGDGVIGAHVYRSKTCARERYGSETLEADFNPKTIGIAILGDYQTKLSLTETVKDSLTNLIAQKAKDFEIIPNGKGYLIDDTYPNIVGHRDLDCTECPGKNLYKELEDIRLEAQEKYENLGGVTEKVVKATIVDNLEEPIELYAGEEKGITVYFRNDGNFTWRNYAENSPKVLALNSDTSFYLASGDSSIVAQLSTPNVPPGGIGKFMLRIKAPEDELEIKENFILQFANDVLENTEFTISAIVINLDYAARYEESNILEATFTGSEHNIIVKVKNKGLETWQKGDVVLNIYDLDYKKSRYYDESWPNENGGFQFQENEVKNNETATFSFTMKSPDTIGQYLQILQLKNNDNSIVNNEFSTITRVDSPFQADYVSDNIPPALLNTWRYKAEIKFKNTGLSPWHRNMVLKIYDLDDEISKFKDSSWVNGYTATRLQEREVKPGEVGTFSFYFKSPRKTGLYYNKFKLELLNKNIEVQNGEIHLVTRVDK